MKVRALQNTYCEGIRFERDVIYHIDAAIAHALGDSVQILEYDNEPEEVADEKPKKKVKEAEAPVVDKMIKKAPAKKSASKRKS